MDYKDNGEKHYNIYDVDGFWEDEEMSLEEYDEVAGIYRELDEVILGRHKSDA